MEMAIGSKAGCLILAACAWAVGQVSDLPGSRTAEFPVQHKHLKGSCAGVLKVDAAGVSFAGPKKHAWRWKTEDIRELKLAPDGVYVLSYRGGYDFRGDVPAQELYGMLKGVMDQRLVMAAVEAVPGGRPPAHVWSVPVKHRGGADGSLAFDGDVIVYASPARDESRTWRYQDIDKISSSGPFQLTLTTFERALAHYNDRKEFNFELKQPISEAKYNELWLLVEKKNGRIP
jgi:hypothetical protein